MYTHTRVFVPVTGVVVSPLDVPFFPPYNIRVSSGAPKIKGHGHSGGPEAQVRCLRSRFVFVLFLFMEAGEREPVCRGIGARFRLA